MNHAGAFVIEYDIIRTYKDCELGFFWNLKHCGQYDDGQALYLQKTKFIKSNNNK